MDEWERSPSLDLHTCFLAGAELEKAHLEGANLIEAHLEGAYLSYSHMEGGLLDNAYLNKASLNGSRLSGAFLINANLTDALVGSFLYDAQMEKAVVSSAGFGYIIPPSWDAVRFLSVDEDESTLRRSAKAAFEKQDANINKLMNQYQQYLDNHEAGYEPRVGYE